jgi:hypothetical protein
MVPEESDAQHNEREGRAVIHPGFTGQAEANVVTVIRAGNLHV